MSDEREMLLDNIDAQVWYLKASKNTGYTSIIVSLEY